jgi:hypothetical protein
VREKGKIIKEVPGTINTQDEIIEIINYKYYANQKISFSLLCIFNLELSLFMGIHADCACFNLFDFLVIRFFKLFLY